MARSCDTKRFKRGSGFAFAGLLSRAERGWHRVKGARGGSGGFIARPDRPMQHETLLRLARYIHVILPGLLVADALHNAFVVHNLWQDRRKVCP